MPQPNVVVQSYNRRGFRGCGKRIANSKPASASEALNNLVRHVFRIKNKKGWGCFSVLKHPWVQSLVPKRKEKEKVKVSYSGAVTYATQVIEVGGSQSQKPAIYQDCIKMKTEKTQVQSPIVEQHWDQFPVPTLNQKHKTVAHIPFLNLLRSLLSCHLS